MPDLKEEKLSQQTKKRATYLSTTEFAAAIDVCPATVRLWDRTGVLKPHHRTPGGKRLYSQSQVNHYLNSDKNS